jgi:hypothetical protein
MRLHKRNYILALQPHITHLSLYTTVAIAKRCTRNGAILNEKQSLSHFLNCCSNNITENEEAQEEQNNVPATLYFTFVFIHGGRNRKLDEKQLFCHFLDCCSNNITKNEVAQEELNTGPTTPYYTFVFIHDGRNRNKLHSQWSRPGRETVVLSLF